MQSANAGSIPGVGAGIPAPALSGGQDIGGKDLMNSKTNSDTVAHVDTNHEGMIVSAAPKPKARGKKILGSTLSGKFIYFILPIE